MKDFYPIKGSQIRPNDIQEECIRVQKVYDWIVDVGEDQNKTPIPGDPDDAATCAGRVRAALDAGNDIRIECIPPAVPGPFPIIPKPQPQPNPRANCRVLSVTNGTSSTPGTIRIVWTVLVRVRIFNDTTGALLCDFDVPVQFDDRIAACIPAPLTRENVLCRITRVFCDPTDEVFLGNQIELNVRICKEIQVEAEVKLEVLAKFCQPRPNDLQPTPPSIAECPPFNFPPQCPTIFPRPNCDCQAEAINASGTSTDPEILGTHNLTANICNNCTLAQSTWRYTRTGVATGIVAARPLTFNQPVCTEVTGGIQMVVTGLAEFIDAAGNITRANYTLTLVEAAQDSFQLVGSTPANFDTGTVNVADNQLLVRDCRTFGDVPIDTP
ncbi:BMQ_0737 family morphogenetic spore coat protein [Bacillus xiapuensis]|uniref:hypothetical protein n=1 Tax=Bacillus xiapuensis TaxID=2014075 RepID=UPI000C230A4A|nr:hypothetical protein [Bacillus xiapuensis]